MGKYTSNILQIYNTLSGKKEVFKPISEGAIGMYVLWPYSIQ